MKVKKKCCLLFSVLILMGILLVVFVWNGVVLLNNPSKDKYPVRGVDVSSYQGEIDWSMLSKQGISFAFLKATEGSSMTDRTFAYNFSEAQKQDIAVGAYHFFSFDSAGKTQAENFIRAVVPFDGMLPPVIDFEFYGDKRKDNPEKEAVLLELRAMIALLEEYYGLSPILYATETTYRMYLAEEFDGYDIWIRDVVFSPKLSDGRNWTFWQFTNRERLEGYTGAEKYIDMNVFSGDKEAFLAYPRYEGEIK